MLPVLRPAEPADIAAVLAFWRESAENTDRHDTAESLQRLMFRDPVALTVATDGELIVGSVIAGWDGWRCHLYRLAVAPSHRGQGIARALVSAAERRFTDSGGARADAMVLLGNAEGAGSWAALGYRPQEQWRRWVKPLVQA